MKRKPYKKYTIKTCKACAINEFRPRSPGQKYCDACLENGNAQRFRMRYYGICSHCGKKIKKVYKWCKDDDCQAAKKEYYEQRKDAAKTKRLLKHKDDYSSIQHPRPKRKEGVEHRCIRCDEDAYPNIRYCPACHTIVTDYYGLFEELSVNVI
jgi:hypothetical protein